MVKEVVVRPNGSPKLVRGNGIVTTLLVCKERCGAANFTSGMTKIPAEMAVPLHSHNCDEHVTVIEGKADVEIDGQHFLMEPQDTAFIPEGVPHRFINVGKVSLSILWVYGTDKPTRTITETGETVAHLSTTYEEKDTSERK